MILNVLYLPLSILYAPSGSVPPLKRASSGSISNQQKKSSNSGSSDDNNEYNNNNNNNNNNINSSNDSSSNVEFMPASSLMKRGTLYLSAILFSAFL